MTVVKRNWKIDLLRFIFAIGVIVHHSYWFLPQVYGFSPGVRGNILVEFFLVVSGYLLAKKIFSAKEEVDIFKLVKNKFLSFYWMWVIVVVLTVIYNIVTGVKDGYELFLPSLFLMHGFGFTNDFITFGWYLSSMMIVTILLTPLIIKVKKRDKIRSDFLFLIFADLFVIGELYLQTQKLTGVNDTFGFLMKSNVRAFAGMLLGVVLFMYRQYIRKPDSKPSVFGKIWGIALQAAAYFYLFMFTNGKYLEKGIGEFFGLGCMGIIVYYAFADSGREDKAPGKLADCLITFCNFLGKLSLPVYLFHSVIKSVVNKCFADLFPFKRLALIITITIILSAAVLLLRYLYDYIKAKIKQSTPPRSGKEMCISYCVAAGLAVALCPVSFGVIDAVYKPTVTILDSSVEYKDKSSTVRCYTSTTISEDFKVENTSKLAEIKFYTITWKKSFADDQQMKVIIRNKDTNEEVYAETRKMSDFRDGNAFSLIPDENVVLTGSSWYTIEFVPTTREEQEYMALLMTRVTNNSGKSYINGQPTDEHISMKIITQEM